MNDGMMTSIRTITTEAEWDELGPAWNCLVERTADPSIFLTWEWQRAWWRCYASHVGAAGLNVLVAEDAGRLVGAAPLYRTRPEGAGPLKLRSLRWIGAGSEDSDYLDFIIEAGREAEVVEAFLEQLAGDTWDVVDLDLVRAGSPGLRAARESASARGYRLLLDESACTALDLPSTWDEYLPRLQSRFRTKVRSLLRRLPAEHGAVFDLCEDPGSLARDLESMFALHQDRWRAAGEPGSFGLPERRAFYREVAERFLERGRLRLYRLRIGDRPAAYEFSFEHGDRVYYLQHAYDPELSNLSVGIALKAYVLRDCIERGVRTYDFLGDDAPHKLAWGAERGVCVRLRIARPGWRTQASLRLPRFLTRTRERARAATPAPLLRLKQRLHRRLRGPRTP